jgi:hypothetical protein
VLLTGFPCGLPVPGLNIIYKKCIHLNIMGVQDETARPVHWHERHRRGRGERKTGRGLREGGERGRGGGGGERRPSVAQ